MLVLVARPIAPATTSLSRFRLCAAFFEAYAGFSDGLERRVSADYRVALSPADP
jgi:hypothetical protein